MTFQSLKRIPVTVKLIFGGDIAVRVRGSLVCDNNFLFANPLAVEHIIVV